MERRRLSSHWEVHAGPPGLHDRDGHILIFVLVPRFVFDTGSSWTATSAYLLTNRWNRSFWFTRYSKASVMNAFTAAMPTRAMRYPVEGKSTSLKTP